MTLIKRIFTDQEPDEAMCVRDVVEEAERDRDVELALERGTQEVAVDELDLVAETLESLGREVEHLLRDVGVDPLARAGPRGISSPTRPEPPPTSSTRGWSYSRTTSRAKSRRFSSPGGPRAVAGVPRRRGRQRTTPARESDLGRAP